MRFDHCFPKHKLGRAIRTERHRLAEWKQLGALADTAVLELYDYQEDPAETKNLAAERPAVVKEMREILARHPEAVER
jgi:iduronate 2-sulfatase